MRPVSEALTITVSINRPAKAVYGFASQPENFARWASGLGRELRKDGRHWRALGPDGPVSVRFSLENSLGVLDHWVRPDGADEIYIPLRVFENGDGAAVALTLFRGAGVSDDIFHRDANWVRRDLETLKTLLEAGGDKRAV